MGRRKAVKIVKQEEEEKKGSVGLGSGSGSGKPDSVRDRLRGRWELASVLNFLHVFKPVIGLKLELSGEEIEDALITPNDALAQLHIALLKGIPPVSKNLSGSDAWVTVLLKKLAPWWPWVAEGEIPLVAANDKEISKYKELDPMMRLLILKALCEIRTFQDDTVGYLNDAMKEGTPISTFRKDRIGGAGNGISYWYDGDEHIGHRLYREVRKVEYMPSSKRNRRLTQPTNSYQWETIATNLEEFQEISVKLSSSKLVDESTVGQMIESEIIPELEKIQKKKEQALKRQQRQEMLLNGAFNYRVEGTRSSRNRKPVCYTFDAYDKSIKDALDLIKKGKPARELRQEKKIVTNGRTDGDTSNGSSQSNDGMDNDDGSPPKNNDGMDIDADDEKLRGAGGQSDSDDEDFDDKNDDDDNNDVNDDDDNDDGSGESSSSESETNGRRPARATRLSQKRKDRSATYTAGLRRSKRLTGDASDPDSEFEQHAGTKKRLRQRPTRNSGYDPAIVSHSEDGNSSEKTCNEASGSEKESRDVLKGLLDESEEENTESEENSDA